MTSRSSTAEQDPLCAESAASPFLPEPLPNTGTVAFVALSKFVVANDGIADVKEAFRNRPHLVDAAPGFVRMEVLIPHDNPDEIWLVTYWADETSYRTWHGSHLYHESHKGIPSGLKLVPRSTEIRMFTFVCS